MKNRNEERYTLITDKQYASHFGLSNPEKEDLHKEAFKKAWEIRNFEIDKFWQRSAYFWGFIALIFTGYVSISTGKNNEIAKKMYLDFYLILLGLIFSVAWFLAICGSKQWQENWERHINFLEDEITGPLYKSLYFKRRKYYYSVSKMNKIPSGVIIVTWVFLLMQYFYNNFIIIKNLFESINNNFKVFFFLVLPLFGTVFFILCYLKDKQTVEN